MKKQVAMLLIGVVLGAVLVAPGYVGAHTDNARLRHRVRHLERILDRVDERLDALTSKTQSLSSSGKYIGEIDAKQVFDPSCENRAAEWKWLLGDEGELPSRSVLSC